MDHPGNLNSGVKLGLWARLHRCEQGQTASLFLMMMMVASSVFMGAVWDMSNAWMHKQWADTAAQAACSAGTMDMAWAANNIPVGSTPTTPVPSMNFLPGAGLTNSGDCGSNSSNPICYYAKINGYDGVTHNDVQWATSTTPPPSLGTGSSVMTVSANGVPAFLNVTVTDNVPAYFFGAFSKILGMSNSWQSVPVVGHCNCGLVQSGSTSTSNIGAISTGASCSLTGSSCTSTSSALGSNVPITTGLVQLALSLSGNGPNADLGLGWGILSYTCDGGHTWQSGLSLSSLGSSEQSTSWTTSCGATNLDLIGIQVTANAGGSPGSGGTTMNGSVSVSSVTSNYKLSAASF